MNPMKFCSARSVLLALGVLFTVAMLAEAAGVMQMRFERKDGLKMKYLRAGKCKEFEEIRKKWEEKRGMKKGGEDNVGDFGSDATIVMPNAEGGEGENGTSTTSTTEYSITEEDLRVLSKRAVVSSPQNNYWDSVWVGWILLSNANQWARVIFDSGSANLWVMDKTCTMCAAADEPHFLFNSQQSSSYVADGTPFKIDYMKGHAYGFQGKDTVKLYNSAGNALSIPGVTFGQVDDTDDQMTSLKSDGIFGLAFQSISVNGVRPPLLRAIDLGLLDRPMFTTWLNTQGGNVDESGGGGVFTFGGFDSTNCGSVIGWANLTSATHWQFSLGRIYVGTAYQFVGPVQAISDTGTTLILGPPTQVASIAKAVGATWDAVNSLYKVKCAAVYTPVDFFVSGMQLRLNYKVLTMDVGMGNGDCMFGIQPATIGGGISWLFGDPFIRQWCNVHDFGGKRIGFAPSKLTMGSG